MSRIDELIADLSPEGVAFKRLGNIACIKNGKDHKSLSEGDIPVYGSGGIMRYVDTYAYDKPSVLIPRKGSLGNLFYVDVPFWNVDTIFYTEVDGSQVLPKFLYYFLTTVGLGEMNQAGGVPSQTQSVLNELKIPVPPLEVQREIVKVLDTFTQLKAELEARRRQYGHYRNALLSFDGDLSAVMPRAVAVSTGGHVDSATTGAAAPSAQNDGVRWATLGEIAINLDSQRRPVSKSARTTGNIPYYGASGIVDYVSDYIFDGDYLLVSEDGANLLARSTPIAFSISGKTWVNNHAHVLQFDTYAERRFAEIYLNSIDLSPYVSSAAQPKLNQTNLNRIPIPIPPFEEQARIVAILDKFDALVNDLSSGLPAEIKARRQQYEHYRDRLLSFKEAA